MVCAVETVAYGVPDVFVSRQFQRRVQSPVTGGLPHICSSSQH